MNMTDIRKDIEAILGECVGVDCERKKYEPTDFLAHRADYNDGYNQALADTRTRIPETARKVLERVREERSSELELLATHLDKQLVGYDSVNLGSLYQYIEERQKALAVEDEGDNGKDND